MQIAPALSESEVRTYLPGRFDVADVLALKRNFRMNATSRQPTISVIIPARNCAATIGMIVGTIYNDLVVDAPLVDEILVVDHNSTDDTASVATAAGARVVSFDEVLPECQTGGKGSVMRKGVYAATGDIVVFVDGDHLRFDSFKVVNLIAPLLQPENIVFTKGYYHGYGGGRSTETIGRAAVSIFDPELAGLQQPFSGEQATFRQVFADMSIAEGWYIELSLLHQVKKRFGAKSIAQVDLEYKEHESGDTSHITKQVHEILIARLTDAMAEAGHGMPADWGTSLRTPSHDLGSVEEREPTIGSLPPLSSLDGWRDHERTRIRSLRKPTRLTQMAQSVEDAIRRRLNANVD